MAVEEDFRTWLPKLAPDAIVMFHDISPDSGYESAQHWSEMKDLYPHIEFGHSYGLGVLFPVGDRWYRQLESTGAMRWIEAYRWRADARLAARQLRDTQQQLEDRWAVVQQLEEMVRARDEALEAQQQLLETRWSLMQDQERMIQARDQQIEAQASAIAEIQRAVDMPMALVRRMRTVGGIARGLSNRIHRVGRGS
jgi:hypothetical protein